MQLSAGTEISLDWRDIPLIIGWAWRMIRPRPYFGNVSQEAALSADQSRAWWHINISVQRWCGRRDLPCCRAFLVFVEPNPFDGPLRLKWQSDLRYGSQEATLIQGDERRLPLILRQDNAEKAVMTDFIYFAEKEPKHGIVSEIERSKKKTRYLEEGTYKTILKIESGDVTWESPHFYIIKVPKAGTSNSHFSIGQERRKKRDLWRAEST